MKDEWFRCKNALEWCQQESLHIASLCCTTNDQINKYNSACLSTLALVDLHGIYITCRVFHDFKRIKVLATIITGKRG